MKKYVLVLIALAFSLASAACKNPTAPSASPVGANPGGGNVAVVAAIDSWAIYPSIACYNTFTCDEGQVLRPNSEGRYELNPNFGYELRVIFRNPQQPGRSVSYTLTSAFSNPASFSGKFDQTGAGGQALKPVMTGFNVVRKSETPVVTFEAIETGPGLEMPTVMKITVLVKF